MLRSIDCYIKLLCFAAASYLTCNTLTDAESFSREKDFYNLVSAIMEMLERTRSGYHVRVKTGHDVVKVNVYDDGFDLITSRTIRSDEVDDYIRMDMQIMKELL